LTGYGWEKGSAEMDGKGSGSRTIQSDIVGQRDIVVNYGISPEVIANLVKNVASARPDDVQAVAANQIGLLLGYHQIVQAQSRRSFDWALIGAGTGLAFFIVAAGFTIWTGKAVEAIIPAVAGAVVEVIAGVVFFLYGKTTSQMGEFHSRLERLQLYLVANSMCESLSEQRETTRSELIREIARFARGEVKGEAGSPMQKS
jgi:hypothetical protein